MSEGVPADAFGLAQLRRLIATDGAAPIGQTLQFKLVEVDDGRAVFEGVPGRHVYNPLGTVHGGYAAALLDSACGIATHTRIAADQTYTTLEIKIAYHRPMTDRTGPVRATGLVTVFGRRIAYAEGKLTDGEGRLLASATSTLLVMTR